MIAVDALDECNQSREDLLNSLRDLGETPSFAVFLTSRRDHDIADVFFDKPSISLNNLRNRIDADMKAYINDELQKRARLAQLPTSLKAEMAVTLVNGADGM